jgi:mono/diheme cytochrome c family protein
MFLNMFPKMLPEIFREISPNPGSNVEASRNVEERRFSAASSATDDAGFSPSGNISRRSRLFPQPVSRNVKNSLVRTSAVLPLLALVLASPFSALAQKPAGASATADLPPGAMQAKATTACLECHEARIILQQRLSKPAWTKEVDKMTKWGAVVDPADRDALIDYLSTNFSPDKPAYEPQRTTGSGKTSK